MELSDQYIHLPVDEDKVMDLFIQIYPGLIPIMNSREILTLCMVMEDMTVRYEEKGF